jgi:hypothetical protein
MNLGNMTFDNGILHLANWLGNVIMPTIAAAFIIIAILQFSKGQEFSHSMYGALACSRATSMERPWAFLKALAEVPYDALEAITLSDDRMRTFRGLSGVGGGGPPYTLKNVIVFGLLASMFSSRFCSAICSVARFYSPTANPIS